MTIDSREIINEKFFQNTFLGRKRLSLVIKVLFYTLQNRSLVTHFLCLVNMDLLSSFLKAVRTKIIKRFRVTFLAFANINSYHVTKFQSPLSVV